MLSVGCKDASVKANNEGVELGKIIAEKPSLQVATVIFDRKSSLPWLGEIFAEAAREAGLQF